MPCGLGIRQAHLLRFWDNFLGRGTIARWVCDDRELLRIEIIWGCMTANSSDQPKDQPNIPQPEHEPDTEALVRSLRRKEGNWLAWGQACQQLQKAGYSPQKIFEETGFEPIQQNQIIVAAQVYGSILAVGTTDAVRSRFETAGSDSLYELRILNQEERAAAAALLVEKGMDSEGAHEVARALKEFSRLGKPPEEFPDYPHDAIAHYYWKLARLQKDLQERSRLIALALRFARSESARRQVELLLTDFTVPRAATTPRIPFYRLETESEVPKVLPVAGELPLSTEDFQAVPLLETEAPFGLVKFAGAGAWVPMPGWQVVLAAEDPVVLLGSTEQLPDVSDPPESVLILVDRAQRQWDEFSYFLVDQAGQLHIQWSERAPSESILGKIVLVLRPRRVLDEDYNKELWQLDE